jgi:protein-S-isoprenylcysteine O-methyltransferase Ste14
MSAPEEEQDEHAPLWPPLLLTAAVLMLATRTRHPKLALTALATLVVLPTVWRVFKRRWGRGDVLRGLGMGFIASHVPLLLGACSTLDRPECRIRLCLDGVLAGATYVPWAGVLGTLFYWAWTRNPNPGAPR